MQSIQVSGGNKAVQADGVPGFGGGQVSNLRPSMLAANQSEQLTNVDLIRLEDATTRRGFEQLGTGESAGANRVLGMGFFKVGLTEKLVRVKNTGTMKVQTHDGVTLSSWVDAAGWTPSAADCDVVQGNNKLFFANGLDNLRSWDGAAFTDMGTGYPNPPKYANLIYATNRLIGYGDSANPDTIGFSNILGEGVWSGTNTLRPGAGDGDGVSCCVMWTKTLMAAFKRTKTFVVNIDPSLTVANMPIDTVSESIGCVGPRAACKVGKDIWFMTDEGLRSMTRVLNGEDTEVVPPISFPVGDVLDTINREALSTVCCTFYGDRFFLAIPTGNSTQPDTVLVALVLGAEPKWLGVWTGLAPCQFVRTTFGKMKRLNIARSDGRVWRWRDYITEDNEAASDYQDVGEPIATDIVTRRMNHGTSERWKQGFTIELEFNQSTADVSVYGIPDGELQDTPLLTASSAIGFLMFPISFPLVFPAVGIKRQPGTLMHTKRFREMAYKITAESGKVALRKVTATAFIKNLEVKSQ